MPISTIGCHHCDGVAEYRMETPKGVMYQCKKKKGHQSFEPVSARPAPPVVQSGYEAPPPVHREAHATELEAQSKMAGGAKKWRARVLRAVSDAGPTGLTGWEACVLMEMTDHQSTVRTRLTELASEQHGRVIVRSDTRRENANGNMEGVYVTPEHHKM
jgi:hypothetical protein